MCVLEGATLGEGTHPTVTFRRWNFYYFSTAQFRSGCVFSQGFTESVEMTKSPTQR